MFQNDFHSLSTGGAGAGFWTGALSGCFCSWGVGLEAEPERIQGAGVVPEPPSEMAQTRASSKNRLHQFNHAKLLPQQQLQPDHPFHASAAGYACWLLDVWTVHLRAGWTPKPPELRPWLLLGIRIAHLSLHDVWNQPELLLVHVELAWHSIVQCADESPRVLHAADQSEPSAWSRVLDAAIPFARHWWELNRGENRVRGPELEPIARSVRQWFS